MERSPPQQTSDRLQDIYRVEVDLDNVSDLRNRLEHGYVGLVGLPVSRAKTGMLEIKLISNELHSSIKLSKSKLSQLEIFAIGRKIGKTLSPGLLRRHFLSEAPNDALNHSELLVLNDLVSKQLLKTTPSEDKSVRASLLTSRPTTMKGREFSLLTDNEVEATKSTLIFEGEWEDIWPNQTLLPSKEAAELLNLTPQGLNKAVKRNEVIGLRRAGKRHIRIPMAQFDKKNMRLRYLDTIIEETGSHERAWHFLTSNHEFRDAVERPLDRMLRGEMDSLELHIAARAFGQDFM